jgi:hypothetical protein
MAEPTDPAMRRRILAGAREILLRWRANRGQRQDAFAYCDAVAEEHRHPAPASGARDLEPLNFLNSAARVGDVNPLRVPAT